MHIWMALLPSLFVLSDFQYYLIHTFISNPSASHALVFFIIMFGCSYSVWVCMCKCTDTNGWTRNVPCVTHCSKRAQNYTKHFSKAFFFCFFFGNKNLHFFCILGVVKTKQFSSSLFSALLLFYISQQHTIVIVSEILVGYYFVCFYRISGHLWMFSVFGLRIEADHAK